ncbi:MAG: hypothetical protein HFE85_00240 [Clostridiales bacterium]|nr:hypothetical protein [Clostridiales bacterium]
MDDQNRQEDRQEALQEMSVEETTETPETEEIVPEQMDELQALREQLDAAEKQIAEQEEKLIRMQQEYEAALGQCREEAERTHFEDRLELELWKSGAKNPRAVRALLQMNELSLSEDGVMNGLAGQLAALRQSDSYLFLTPASVGSKGNFVRPRESVQDQSLKDAIASYYFG